MSFLKSMLLVTGLCQVASMLDVNQCTEGKRSPVDYGDLNQPGSGRILTIQNTQFEVFGEKVFLSGANAYIEEHKSMFGNGIYNSKHLHRHECFLWEVSQSGGNSVHAHVHGTGTISPLFNVSGHVTTLDRSGTFITDVRKYLRAAAHYNIVVFFSLWHREIFHHHPAVATDDAVLQSYIDNALQPLVKAIKDERGFGGIIILENAEQFTNKTKSSDPCFDATHLHYNRNGLFSMESLLRFAGRQVAAIRSIDRTIPITLGGRSDELIKNKAPYINNFGDKCLGFATGYNGSQLSELFTSGEEYAQRLLMDRHRTPYPVMFCHELTRAFRQSTLSFYTIDGRYSSTSPFAVDETNFNLDKPLIIYNIQNVTLLKESYNWAYSHGYSGAWTSERKRDHLLPIDHMTGIKSLKSEDNPSLGGLVNFTLTKYRICKLSDMSQCVNI